MTESLAQPSKLHVLFVDCAQNAKYKDTPTEASGITLSFVSTSADAVESMKYSEIDCVLVRIDPGSQKNIEQMETMRDATREQCIPLISMATFNASWVENLMAQLGVQQHFRQLPTEDDISSVLVQHEHSMSRQVGGLSQ